MDEDESCDPDRCFDPDLFEYDEDEEGNEWPRSILNIDSRYLS